MHMTIFTLVALKYRVAVTKSLLVGVLTVGVHARMHAFIKSESIMSGTTNYGMGNDGGNVHFLLSAFSTPCLDAEVTVLTSEC